MDLVEHHVRRVFERRVREQPPEQNSRGAEQQPGTLALLGLEPDGVADDVAATLAALSGDALGEADGGD